ncbi:UNVERIFIED_CONTAM: putative peroxidase 26 [Sesamum angustifolium]|uniref:Peroxidase n=1 Tax=Sesamum angustifolium TaxID=2727405 RepID=A0AAW2IWR5_9LAMI
MDQREGWNVMVITLVVAVGLSLYVGRMQAAVTLPPEARSLKRQYYKKLNTCANVEAFVQHQVKLWWDKDKSIAPKMLKILYADCMINGCDASILLDGPQSEKKALQDLSVDAFLLIDRIKTVVDDRCKGPVVSCADILNLAVRDALHLAGAPSYPVLLGRRDGLGSNAAWVDLPSPSISSEGLAYFRSKGLDAQDYATLLGSHTMGKAHCSYIRSRLYNFNKTGKVDTTMSKSTLDKLRRQCPSSLKKGQEDPTVFLTDKYGPQYTFSNAYYSNVLSKDSVLRVDQQLLFNNNTSSIVLEYAGNFEEFRQGFALSISRMGCLKVLTGKQGEIRRNCRFTNKNNPKIK